MALDISPEQVSYIISMAREIENTAPVEADDDESHRGEADDPELVEEHEYDTAYQELAGYLETLSDDDLVALVALIWIGRGTYDNEELDTALEEAAAIGIDRIPGYLLSIPLLAEYLEEGATALGLTVEEA